MRDISVDHVFGVLIAKITRDEFPKGDRDFWHEGEHYTIKRMQLNKDGSITIEARRSDAPEHRDTLAEYPMYTVFSPKGKTHSHIGRIEKRKGKSKLVAKDLKPYEPLKHDTDTGYGERRKRYVR